MKKTKLVTLFWIALASFVLGVSVTQLAIGFGLPFPVMPISLGPSLVLIGVAIYLSSLPVASYLRAREKGKSVLPPNPFYATRVVIFAKAGALTASGFLGWHLGQLIWGLSTGVVAELIIGTLLLLGGSSAIALVGSVLAERNCRISDSGGEEAA